MQENYIKKIATLQDEFESYLKVYIKEHYNNSSILSEACSYALSGKGKRLRPMLCLLVSDFVNGSKELALRFSLALEMIHCYSLVHDDLPILDNDDLRRGRATVHKKYNEATALLVGDALLSDAFGLLSSVKNHSNYSENILKAISKVSAAIGSKGMVYGQSLDMYWTGKNDFNIEVLRDIHKNKTSQLIAISCFLGSLTRLENSDIENNNFFNIGLSIGLAFQILDDIIDDQPGIGKTVGKDKEQGKLSYISFMGSDLAKEEMKKILGKSIKSLPSLSTNENYLAYYLKSIFSYVT